jgi:hypothetical protein
MYCGTNSLYQIQVIVQPSVSLGPTGPSTFGRSKEQVDVGSLSSLRKSNRELVTGRSHCLQSAVATSVDVNTCSVKSTTGKNADVSVFIASDEGLVTVVNKKEGIVCKINLH